MHRELRSLYQRARLLRLAIILEGLSIFGIALTIVLLFVSLNIQLNTYYVPQFLFLMSLVLAIAGTILFVKDFAVSLALIEMDMQLRSDVEIQDVKTESVFKMLD